MKSDVITKTVRKNLKQIRNEKGLSFVQVAKRMILKGWDTTGQKIYHLETNNTSFNLDFLRDLAKIYRVRLAAFLKLNRRQITGVERALKSLKGSD